MRGLSAGGESSRTEPAHDISPLLTLLLAARSALTWRRRRSCRRRGEARRLRRRRHPWHQRPIFQSSPSRIHTAAGRLASGSRAAYPSYSSTRAGPRRRASSRGRRVALNAQKRVSFAAAASLLTLWSAEMHHGVVVFEHVHFFNVINWLHAYHREHESVQGRATYRTS